MLTRQGRLILQDYLDDYKAGSCDSESNTKQSLDWQSIDKWILASIKDQGCRASIGSLLERSTKAFTFQHSELIATLGRLHIEISQGPL